MNFPDLHLHVFNSLTDGVIVVRRGGKIETVNPAALRLLGLKAGEAENCTFAELFIAREGFDDLTQLLLDVAGGQMTGEHQIAEIRSEGKVRSLSVTAFRIALPGSDGSEAMATGVTFSDLTEIRELRENELRMAQAAEEQHHRLQDAYREIEERNQALNAALKRVRVIQGTGILLAGLLFLVTGLWAFRPLDTFDTGADATLVTVTESEASSQTFEVRPELVTSSITLKGRLQPWRKVAVASPVEGAVATVHFRTGQAVSEGQLLVEMDVGQAKSEYPAKRASYAEAAGKIADLENWEHSAEMSAARRSFRKAELDLESGRTSLNRVQFLFEQGLIPAAQYEDEKRKHQVQLLDYEAAKEELASIAGRGDDEAIDIARLAADAAETELRAIEEVLASSQVKAPIDGVVLAPSVAGRELTVGSAASRGQSLLEIGDFSRLAAAVQVDESDVVRLSVGQAVKATGDAFPGLTLTGSVTHVSSQADPKKRGAPMFDVVVTFDPVGPEEAARLRAGMSARLEIVVYRNPQALTVPVAAVRKQGGEYRLRVMDSDSGTFEDRVVEIGPTTLSRVEIVSGLKAGERVAVPQR